MYEYLYVYMYVDVSTGYCVVCISREQIWAMYSISRGVCVHIVQSYSIRYWGVGIVYIQYDNPNLSRGVAELKEYESTIGQVYFFIASLCNYYQYL